MTREDKFWAALQQRPRCPRCGGRAWCYCCDVALHLLLCAPPMASACYQAPSCGRCSWPVPDRCLVDECSWSIADLWPLCPRWPGDARHSTISDLLALRDLRLEPGYVRRHYVREVLAAVALEVP